jgi:hypothetical protein
MPGSGSAGMTASDAAEAASPVDAAAQPTCMLFDPASCR